uniref:Putative dromyosuppressin n=1 Tax=Corethrella appendiculata TaxID=1370023 RepID=U5ESF3_9DIPT
MQSQIKIVLLCTMIITISIIGCQASATAIPPLCGDGLLDEMPPRIKRVCAALENSNQLAEALNAYIRKEAQSLLYQGEDLIAPGAGKRTDVDHVFLRFGRRR